jgi:hypothetical protein
VSPKVFCIGFHKTGTTSMAAALRILGYRVKGSFGARDPRIAETAVRRATRLAARYDAFQDNPWPLVFREMDERFPGSKFILTVRDPDSWIASQLDHFGPRDNAMRRWIYGAGTPRGNEEAYVARMLRHEAEVREHFAGRPGDLLVLNLADGEGWEPLCRFLGKEIPDVPFPRRNDAASRRRRWRESKTRWGRIRVSLARRRRRLTTRLPGRCGLPS